MGLSLFSNRKEIFRRRKILTEINKKNNLNNFMLEGYYILDFNPYSKRNKTEFLVYSDNKTFPIDLINWNKEYCSFDIKVIDNIGETDGSDFLEWISCFYDSKNGYYRFNIYDLDAKDIDLYIINENFEKLIKFNLTSTVVKNPVFFNSNKSKDNNSPQVGLTLCTKNSVVLNKIKF